jgi:hypothetical protein
MPTFTLEFDDLSTAPSSGKIASATWLAIEAALRRLAESDSGFVIVGQNDLSFLQTARTTGPRPEVIVEWQDGDTDRHFMLPKTVENPDLLVELFSVYFETPELIASAAPWIVMEL